MRQEKSYLPPPQTKLEGMDIILFAVGIGWSYIASVPGRGFSAAETFGAMTGNLLRRFRVLSG
jgi:hypothetical protein